jgi:hypothetical protein
MGKGYAISIIVRSWVVESTIKKKKTEKKNKSCLTNISVIAITSV